MIEEFITKNNEYLIEFKDFNGSGWYKLIEKIIMNNIKPEKSERNNIEITWEYSEIEGVFTKDNVEFILHLDDEGSRYLLLKSTATEENKTKLREWATLIAEEVKESR